MAKTKKAAEPKAKKKAGKAAKAAAPVADKEVTAESPVETAPAEVAVPVEAVTEPPAESAPAPAAPPATVDAKPKGGKAKKAAKAKAAKPTKEKKLSAIDAAAQVLEMANQPMNCAELIEAMDRRGLWSSPNGKTPAATLYSALLREINTKGKDARFAKADRGTFTRRTKGGAA